MTQSVIANPFVSLNFKRSLIKKYGGLDSKWARQELLAEIVDMSGSEQLILNSTIYAAMFLVPILNIYPLFRFLSYVQANLGKNGKKAYILPPLLLSALACSWILAVIPLACPIVLPISWLSWLYVVYMTQTLFNENGVEPV